MKWITHTSVPVATALCFGIDPAVLIGLTAGTVLPDVIDRVLSGGDKKRWAAIHRKSSHWFGWYLLLLLVAVSFDTSLNHFNINREFLEFFSLRQYIPKEILHITQILPLGAMLYGLALGALSHIALDALNPSGVPIYPHDARRRFKVSLLSTGSWQEMVFTAACLLTVAAFGAHENTLPILNRLPNMWR